MQGMMLWTLALNLLVVEAASIARQAAGAYRQIDLDVPTKLYSTIRPIDGAWQSFSIEYCYMADYFGNKSHPNKLSYNLLQNLKDRSGKDVIIRAGGTTANRAVFNASQEVGVINVWHGDPTADQPSVTNIGPAWYESFQTALEGTKFIYDINYRDNTSTGVNNTLADAKRAWDALSDRLYAFELGNEAEGWNKVGRAPDWSPAVYVPDYLNYTNLFDKQLWGKDAAKVEPFFQGGVFQGSGGAYLNEPWNSEVVLGLGLDDEGQIKSMSQHDYHGSNCASTTQIPQLRQNLLNHTNVVNRVYPHHIMSPVVDTYGTEYVLGETNSISCQGADNVSNVFGSALWYLDYNLYVAANTSVAKMYFHHGTTYRYGLWAPFEGATNNSALIRPTYYSALMLAEAIGGSGGARQVHAVWQEETFVAYSLYAAGSLDSLVIVNMNPFNATTNSTTNSTTPSTSSTSRPYVELTLPAFVTQSGSIYRLTAAGSNVKDGVTWAGQSVSESGVVTGKEESERYAAGSTIKLQDSEAIFLKFH